MRPNGEVRWCYGAGIISRDAAGKPVRMNGVTVDITDRKRAEERQVLLAREVDHRAKNTLAVVLSVLRLTAAKTTADFISTVEGRVHALAATHNLLSATRWEGADLGKIVEEEMAPYHANHRQRVISGGPAVVLLPATAQAVALALHELATNAAKYGALSTETGTLSVTWRVGREALVLDWTETGGPPTAEPARLGFGLTIVRSSIEAQFRGGVGYDWRPEGLRCTLSIPAAQIVIPRRRRRGNRARTGRPTAGTAQPRRHAPAGGRGRAAGQHAAPGRSWAISAPPWPVPYGRLADGLAAAKAERFDGAILDLNLAGESADPLADLLLARAVPFVFMTGYQRDSIDRRYANVPVLQKPIESAALERAAVAARSPARTRANRSATEPAGRYRAGTVRSSAADRMRGGSCRVARLTVMGCVPPYQPSAWGPAKKPVASGGEASRPLGRRSSRVSIAMVAISRRLSSLPRMVRRQVRTSGPGGPFKARAAGRERAPLSSLNWVDGGRFGRRQAARRAAGRSLRG